MVYKVEPYELKFDHYRRWVATPSSLVTEKTVAHMRSLKLFERVTTQMPHDQNCLMLTGTIKQFEEVVGSAEHVARVSLWIEVQDFPKREVCWAGMLNAEEPIRDRRARLMVIGSALDDPALIKIIEDQGGLVVTDALCFGSRYFWEPVELEGDPLFSLSRSYLSRPKCPRMMNQHASLLEFIMDMVQEFRVDGIIYQKMRFCNLWGGESLFLDKKLQDAMIPVLPLQREHIINDAGQIATRVEAFIEMIKGVV